ncbi:MAG: hypothetical protein M1828_006237 [Chrysothrix sp. TS-e1954]|nr:MAG: hypothetical protein M1828_006237 [Chrysothrix sp. TS-e1954]
MAAERSIIEGSYKSKKYTDLTLVCEGVEFSAHRMVLCAKSPVFACQCDGSFEESRNRRVHVAIEDAPTLVMMLQYIYTGTYELQTGSEANASAEQMEDHEAEQAALLDLHRKITPNFALLAHLKVMCMADYYGVSDLIQRASHNFCQVLPCCYPSKKIDNYSAWKVEGFIDVAKKYYEQTPEHLQSQLGPQLREMMKANRVSFVHDDEFMQAASAIPAFMLDMLKHAHEDYHQERLSMAASEKADSGDDKLDQYAQGLSGSRDRDLGWPLQRLPGTPPMEPNFAFLTHLRILKVSEHYRINELTRVTCHELEQITLSACRIQPSPQYSHFSTRGFIEVINLFYSPNFPRLLIIRRFPMYIVAANRNVVLIDQRFMRSASWVPKFMLEMAYLLEGVIEEQRPRDSRHWRVDKSIWDRPYPELLEKRARVAVRRKSLPEPCA